MWRFAGNDDKESIKFKSDELSVDEESVRSVKWCIDGATGGVCLCADPKAGCEEGEGGRGWCRGSEITVNRRQTRKEKTLSTR